jgi:hypothetical protein
MNGDRLTRYAAVAAVLAVAAVAAWVSYRHAVTVVSAHGEPGTTGRWYPVTIDGLIVASSMVLLDAARHREAAPVLARWLLAAGIGATLAVNVLAGVPSGSLGAVIASWPALAFVGCYELLMMLVRASARRTAREPEQGAPAASVNGSGLHPAEVQPFTAELGRGEVPSLRRIRAELRVGQPKAQEIQARLATLARTP